MKPHFPAYAKITLCVLLVLIIFTEFRLKGHWVFGNINIIFFSFEFFIILLLCFVGKRAENVLIAAVLLEWLLIIQFLQDVCRYGYNFRNDRLFIILTQVPVFILIAYFIFKKVIFNKQKEDI
ncbi:MAG: hypothetical protein PVF58_22970 [Candidatus Methanofastidiosia archaeon]|jgi:hypothetical protein